MLQASIASWIFSFIKAEKEPHAYPFYPKCGPVEHTAISDYDWAQNISANSFI